MFAVPALDSAAPNPLGSGADARYQLRSVSRALRLLDVLADHGEGGLTATEAAAALGASKSATFAMLQTLVGQDYATLVEPGPRYRLGPAVLRLADSHVQSMPLIDVVRPVMQALTRRTGWTSRLAVHQHGYPVFVDRVDGPGSIRFYTQLGSRELPHRSAAGKAILADLDEATVRTIATESGLPRRTPRTITTLPHLLEDLADCRCRGYAVDDEEDDVGVVCVGAAFSSREARPAGAVSITGLKSAVTDEQLHEFGRVVRDHADQMTAALGGAPRQVVRARPDTAGS